MLVHCKEIGGLVLIPAAASKLSIPIIASGGIADGRGLAGALALGADAINMGTRFVATREAPVNKGIKKAIVDMTETDTALIFRTFGNTARVYKNKVATQVLEIERAEGDFSQIHPLVGGIQQEIAWSAGDKGAGMVTFGMCGGLIHDVPTYHDLVNTIMVDAEEIVKSRLTSML